MKNKDQSFREIIHNILLKDIIGGKINTGEKLVELELAKKYKVSRTPIREALLQLDKEGFISHRKYIGAVVRKMSVKEIKNIYEVIAQLEAYAARVAADNISKKDLSYLRTLLNDMDKLIKKEDYNSFVKKNLEFHGFLIKKCENEILEKIVKELRISVYRIVSQGLTLPKHGEKFLEWHKKIVDALSERNAAKAGDLVRAHVEEVKKRLLEKLLDSI